MLRAILPLLISVVAPGAPASPGTHGYYRYPAIHGDSIVFTAHGDLYKVSAKGGAAQPLTTHPGEESNASISPDGSTIAFSATYEGPTEVYVMPLSGGLPTRLTYEGGEARVTGWTPEGKILYVTGSYSTLPNAQLMAVDPKSLATTPVPLNQASDGCYDGSGILYFTRLPFQGSHTRRYKGGTAQNIWKYAPGAPEAVPLTADYEGTSKAPMFWKGRIYFVSDRDGFMNLWSMNPDGKQLKQLTHHLDWDVQSPSLDSGRIVYQLGADLRIFDIGSGRDEPIDITLASDLDQTREKWVDKPMDYLSAAHISANGEKVALTARGQVFVAPVHEGRFVEVTRKSGVRYRNARFAPDGKSIYVLSDESGEVEWWTLPPNGVGAASRVTSDSKVLTVDGVPSPDGRWLVYGNKDQELWLLDTVSHKATRIASSPEGEFGDFAWSPDSRWLAYVTPTRTFSRIMLYGVQDGHITPLTSERSDSSSPAWSPDGKWLYFLSNRTFRSVVSAPWGSRQPEPYFDRQTRIYQIAMTSGLRSPFQPPDELHAQPEADKRPPAPADGAAKSAEVKVELEGIQTRLWELPVPSGNYDSLSVAGTRILYITSDPADPAKRALMALEIANRDVSPKSLLDAVRGYELSEDRKHILIMRADGLYVVDSGAAAPASLDKARVDLTGWSFPLQPREEWRQMLVEAWRLERDYFYDRKMHGVDWPAVLKRVLPLADRVTDRAELSDLLGQMVSELSALHIFVSGGDFRRGTDSVAPASLGALWSRDDTDRGYRVDRIYHADPDYPGAMSPLARPGVEVTEGEVIQAINGVSTLSVPDPAALLRNQAGKQTLLHVRSVTGAERDVIAIPISEARAFGLRYDDWELSRRKRVEEAGKGAIGYVHLRAMGAGDIAQWERDFYPVFDRQGLIIDVRHNGGGNIDSWILEKLLRRAWFYWQPRVGNPTWNMQWAFRGHLVVLCDEHTASDGEAFTEGFRRLGLGKVIGTRTWGGEVWLSMDNRLVDKGIASAAETGVFGPEGSWLIEGHGVDPDIVVDDFPHATYLGEDAQLKAAIEYLQTQIREHPVPEPHAPAYPNKSFVPKAPKVVR